MKYYQEKKSCLLLDYIKLEMNKKVYINGINICIYCSCDFIGVKIANLENLQS